MPPLHPFTPSPPHPLTPSLLPLVILSAILALAAFLRFYALDTSSLWSDEGNTWALIQRSFGQIARDAAADIHPPGYYWLLKVWSMLFGTSAYAMRSFSAICGVLLVWVVYAIATKIQFATESQPSRITDHGSRIRQFAIRNLQFPLLAALLAALNPFQIYYSQEARMYILLALESAGLMWAMVEMTRRGTGDESVGWGMRLGRETVEIDAENELPAQRRARLTNPPISSQKYNGIKWQSLAIYVLCAIAGLWTHYSFPIILVAAGLYWLINLRLKRPLHPFTPSPLHPFPFIILNLLVLLAFLPWLPTALTRIFAWPTAGNDLSPLAGLQLVLRTLVLGPIHISLQPLWLWLTAVALLPLLGTIVLRRNRIVIALLLWLALPIGLMFAVGLFRDAYLKFLLVASPAWCLLAARLGSGGDRERGRQEEGGNLSTSQSLISNLQSPVSSLVIIIFACLLAYPALSTYYADPIARDNYQGVARYVVALGDPQRDLILLNAPGQSEVWNYYNREFPTLALPTQRPPDEAQTIADLQSATANRRRLFALFWAMDEADPQRIVERWLDANAFKGIDSWQGNLRFVTYSFASHLQCQPVQSRFGPSIELLEQCQPRYPQEVTAGEPVLVGLRWQTHQPLDRSYKVTLQLLDPRNQVIAQRDSQPSGGSAPTDQWQPSTVINDNHGVTIQPGTPPGDYRLIVALYDGESGARLSTPSGDSLELGSVIVTRATQPIPLEIVPMHQRVDQLFTNGVRLVGYALYERGFVHQPDRVIEPGATVHFVFYWQAASQLSGDLQFNLQLGQQTLIAPLAGGAYPTGQWQPGELVRGEFDLLFDGSGSQPNLTVAEQMISLKMNSK